MSAGYARNVKSIRLRSRARARYSLTVFVVAALLLSLSLPAVAAAAAAAACCAIRFVIERTKATRTYHTQFALHVSLRSRAPSSCSTFHVPQRSRPSEPSLLALRFAFSMKGNGDAGSDADSDTDSRRGWGCAIGNK